MRAEKLMIGNYFQSTDNKGIQRVTIDDLTAWSMGAVYGKPIPLTEEYLFKLGLESYKDVKIKDSGFICMENNVAFIMGNNNPTFDSCFKKQIKTVHELQNLYFALTGEELTFKD